MVNGGNRRLVRRARGGGSDRPGEWLLPIYRRAIFRVRFSVPGNWAVNYDYFLDTHMYNIDKNNCEYCDDAIFGGPSASGYGDSGSIRVWSAWYQSSPKPGYEWSYAIFPNDMYYYYDMLYPTNSLFVFQSDDYRGVVNWTAFARYVPEPATWALMILGFGAVGGALRRERSKRDRLAYA